MFKINELEVVTCNEDEGHNPIATSMLDGTMAVEVATLFHALSDPTRIRIISALAHGEHCVGDLCVALSMSQPAVSYQLRILRTHRIVRARKAGKHVYYILDDEHVRQLYQQGVDHVGHS
jgi:ArsR family transcriptional regulator